MIGRWCRFFAVAATWGFLVSGIAAAASPPVRVVLDPGHGGKDNGCSGVGGTQEKAIVLDVALHAKEELEKTGAYEVLLTRSDDSFVSLSDRTTFANTKQAELFVSLHANTTKPDSVSGFEVYFNGDKDLDEEAGAVAALENAQKEVEAPGPRNPIDRFLWNLTQERYLEESGQFADQMQLALARELPRNDPAARLPNRGLRSQIFYVLNGAAMPAVLIELGYLSNPKDAALLADPPFREKYGHALAAGIEAYSPLYRAETASSGGR